MPFFSEWLTEFTDHDVVSLICPRPLMIHHGKADRIAWWSQVEEEYNIARTHYETHMIEFKRKHVMNIIFNHVRFSRLRRDRLSYR